MRRIIYRAISFSDLELVGIKIEIDIVDGKLEVSKITRDGKVQDKHSLSKIIKTLGVVYDGHLTVEDKCQHRTFSGKIVTNYRFVGKERGDKDWLNSGYASSEIKMATSKMHDMAHAVNRLSNGGSRS